jgi:hypothetical protein
MYGAVEPRIGQKSAEYDEARCDANEADRDVEQRISVQTEDHDRSL